MRRRRLPDDEEEEEEEERPRRRRRFHRGARSSVQEWSDGSDEDAEEEIEEDEEMAPGKRFRLPRHGRWPVFFRARDSLYFEPLVALAIIVVLLVTLWAFTQNWPPMYVVESSSMQHGPNDQLGLINTGDLVLAQKIPADQVQPYVVGLVSGYTTYGEFGDVLLYYANDDTTSTPVIHRALVYLQVNSDGTVTIPEISGLPCGNQTDPDYTLMSSPSGCGWSHVSGLLTLHRVGWKAVNVTIDLSSVGRSSGFITMGDNNLAGSPPSQGITDQAAGRSAVVQPGWIIGAARGMLPWFGSLELLLHGSAQEVPSQSWELMGVTVIGVVVAAMGVHYVFRAEGFEDERRVAEETEEEEETERRPRSRWLSPLRPWSGEEEETEEEEPPRRRRLLHRRRAKESAPPPRRGRPRPHVRRTSAPHRSGVRRWDDEDEL
jgi:signal peptidase I